ncbi:ABC transporter permease [Nocardioides sp. AE5]|uniref:ABC transporter permease n=1 Tax=Nocardioides sp. AE5 TaxID=2962573 RepID=UPI0028819C80|nr:ABC transporter permease [Nocardioides sp. AE5]MDT0202857.1 ABC transporter permease [Nocardioides sp. AE5]
MSNQQLGTVEAIRLVAGREIRAKVFAKSFIWTTIATVAAIILGGVLYSFLGSSEPDRVGVLPASAALGGPVESVSTASGTEVEIVDVADRERGEQMLRDGDLDVLVLSADEEVSLLVADELNSSLTSVFAALAQQQALSGEIEELGGDPSRVGEVVATAAPTVEALEEPAERDGGQIAAGFIAGILIFMALMTTGQMVAQGVVEEKSSRVVELLLATLRPWQLMAGKVLGIGAVGLIQVVAIVVAAAGTALGFGLVDTSSLAVGPTAVWALVWFVLGYATYALAMAGLAALVSRQEDVGSALTPVMMLMMVPYIIGVSVAPWDPDNVLVVVLSYIPFCSPMLMPMRIALGSASTLEALLAVGLTLVLLPLLVWLAGRLYSRGVLRTGARIKLLAALRS